MLMMILIGIAIFVGYRFLAQQIDQYTSTSPVELPKLEMPAEQRQAVKERFDAFKKAVDAETPIEPLVLTSDDLNALDQ